MRLELAKACLEDAREETRRSGVQLLAEEPSAEADFLLIGSLADPSEAVWQRARDVLLHRCPWLALVPFGVRGVPESALEDWRGRAWANLRLAIRRVIEESEPGLDFFERLMTIPGLVPDLVEELEEHPASARVNAGWVLTRRRGGAEEEAEKKQELGKDRNSSVRRVGGASRERRGKMSELRSDAQGGALCHPGGSRQILLAPTYRCNLTCSYCYAQKFARGYPPDMSMEDLEFALSWAAGQGVSRIILCGGEPTAYCHFPQLLAMAAARGMSIQLTSNCLYSPSLREHVAPPEIGDLIAHYEQERMGVGDAAAGLFEDNLKAARDRGLNVMMRYTLTDQSGAGEWRAMMDLAERLHIRQINYGLAFMGSEGTNAHFNYRDAVGAPGGRLEHILLSLCDDAASRGLRLFLCKPFPLCALSPESLRRMFNAGGIRSACGVMRDDFTRNLTINPDLSTFPCNGIAIRGPKISDFADLAEAGRQTAAAVEDLVSRPYHDQCRRCVLWYRGFCQGACFAEHYWMSRGDERPGKADLTWVTSGS